MRCRWWRCRAGSSRCCSRSGGMAYGCSPSTERCAASFCWGAEAAEARRAQAAAAAAACGEQQRAHPPPPRPLLRRERRRSSSCRTSTSSSGCPATHARATPAATTAWTCRWRRRAAKRTCACAARRPQRCRPLSTTSAAWCRCVRPHAVHAVHTAALQLASQLLAPRAVQPQGRHTCLQGCCCDSRMHAIGVQLLPSTAGHHV